MVLAHGIKGDIAQNYRVGALLVKNGVNGIFGVKAHTGEKFAVHTSYPLGGISQTLAGRTFSNRFQKISDDMFNPWLNSILRPLANSVWLLYTGDRVAASTASMVGSTSMVWAVTLLTARSGSLRPVPVMIHTTRWSARFNP